MECMYIPYTQTPTLISAFRIFSRNEMNITKILHAHVPKHNNNATHTSKTISHRTTISNFDRFSLVFFFHIFFLHAENLSGVAACDLDQATSGCRIDNGACSCGYGCKSEYRYPDRATCTTALKVTLPIVRFSTVK